MPETTTPAPAATMPAPDPVPDPAPSPAPSPGPVPGTLEHGTAALPDLAGDAVRHRLAELLRRPVRDEPTASATRGVLAIATGVAAILWPEISLGAMLVVFGVYAVTDAAVAVATAVHASCRRGRLLAQAGVDLAAVAVALIRPDLTRGAVLELLAVWVVVMAVLRLRDAIDLRDGVHVNALLAVLALLAIAGGVSALVAPDDNLTVIMINVWIFTILRGVTLVVPRRPIGTPS
jgi:uncharacterized membrane protein HdeD (DUF308 family)